MFVKCIFSQTFRIIYRFWLRFNSCFKSVIIGKMHLHSRAKNTSEDIKAFIALYVFLFYKRYVIHIST